MNFFVTYNSVNEPYMGSRRLQELEDDFVLLQICCLEPAARERTRKSKTDSSLPLGMTNHFRPVCKPTDVMKNALTGRRQETSSQRLLSSAQKGWDESGPTVLIRSRLPE